MYDQNNLDDVFNQYKMAVRHGNWGRASVLETRLKKLEMRDCGFTWTTQCSQSIDGEQLVSICFG